MKFRPKCFPTHSRLKLVVECCRPWGGPWLLPSYKLRLATRDLPLKVTGGVTRFFAKIAKILPKFCQHFAEFSPNFNQKFSGFFQFFKDETHGQRVLGGAASGAVFRNFCGILHAPSMPSSARPAAALRDLLLRCLVFDQLRGVFSRAVVLAAIASGSRTLSLG